MSEQSQSTSTPENTTAPQTKQNIPVVRVQVDGNSVYSFIKSICK